MAWSRVGISSGALGALTVNLPVGVIAGDLLVFAAVNLLSALGPTPPAGLTQRLDTSFLDIWTRTVADGDPGSVSFTGNIGAAGSICCIAYRGLAPSAPVVGPWNAYSGVTDVTADGIDVGGAGALLLCFCASVNTFATMTAPAGMTEVIDTHQANPAAASAAIFEQRLSSGGASGNRSLTISNPADGATVVLLMAFLPEPHFVVPIGSAGTLARIAE